jgi:hypothetical protein
VSFLCEKLVTEVAESSGTQKNENISTVESRYQARTSEDVTVGTSVCE